MIPVPGGGVEGLAIATVATPHTSTRATGAIHIFMSNLLDGGTPAHR
jgi:hypothetical protein